MQLAFTTAEELADLLERAGEPLDYREVWPRVFALEACPPELMRKLVADLVEADERFVWESSVHIGLAAWRAAHHDLAEVAFTVVDLETTGSTPGFARITEIGAVRIEGGEVVGEFSELVDPLMPISAVITGITGITDEMVRGCPTIDRVLPRFVEFSEGSVLVAHNARFDLSFLDYELGILTRQSFSRPVLDTMRIARRLWPQKRSSLAILSERFNTATKPSHRALADAQATAELLLIFLARLEEDGLRTLEDVVRFCEVESRRNYHKIVLTEKLPDCSGVYIMRDAENAPLYVGKAECLRRRTRDHFLQKQAYGARQALELLDRFDVVETGSEFEALLLESRLIRDLDPPYNERGTRSGGYHYLKLTDEVYPRLYVTPNHLDDGGFYAGPFRSRAFARRLAECLTTVYPLRTCSRLPAAPPAAPGTNGSGSCPRFDMGACLGPCRAELDGTYTAVVDKVRRVLKGDDADLQATLERRLEEHVDALAFEQAAKLRDLREAATQAVRVTRRLRSVSRLHAVIAYPSREPGVTRLWGVSGGGIVVQEDVTPGDFEVFRAAGFLSRLYAATPPRLPLPSETIDEILLVESWLRRHRASVNVFHLPQPPADPATGATIVDAHARELVRRVQTVCV